MKNSIGATPKGPSKAMLHFGSFCNIVLNVGSHSDGCKLPSSLAHVWLAEWKEQYIVEAQQRILLAQFLHTLPLKVCVKLCFILQISILYHSTLAAMMMAVSFRYHCHMSGWLRAERAIYCRSSTKNSIGAILTYLIPKCSCKAVLHFASFCNILFNFGCHNDGCKLPSSLPHTWRAKWKVQYIIETQQRILLVQFLHTLPLKVCVNLCFILQVSTLYHSTWAAIMMAVSIPHHCHMSGWLSGKNSVL